MNIQHVLDMSLPLWHLFLIKTLHCRDHHPMPQLRKQRAMGPCNSPKITWLVGGRVDIPAQIFHQNTEESITVKNQKHLNILVLGHSVQGNNSRLRQRRLAQGHRKLEIDCKSPAPWPRAVPPPSAGVTSVTLGKPERDGKQPFRM